MKKIPLISVVVVTAVAFASTREARIDPPSTPNSIQGITGNVTFPTLSEAAAALHVLAACLPEARDDIDDALDGPVGPVLVVELPSSFGPDVRGMADHDTMMIAEGDGSKDSLAVTASTMSHEAEHMNNAQDAGEEFDPTTKYDDNSTDEELVEAFKAHAEIHLRDFELMVALVCCPEFIAANPPGQIDCETLRDSRKKAEEWVNNTNIDCFLLGLDPIPWKPPPIFPGTHCCDE